MKITMGDPYVVKKDGVLKFSGIEVDCMKYIHNAQPASVFNACKCDGWSMERDNSGVGVDDVQRVEDTNVEDANKEGGK